MPANPACCRATRAVALDGNGCIDIGRQERFALSNGFTVEAWIFVQPQAGLARIISVDNAAPDVVSTDRTGWALEYLGVTRRYGNPFPCLSFTAYAVKQALFKSVSVPVSRWMHVAVVFGRDNAAHLFLNGRQKSSLSLPGPAKVGPAWLSVGATSFHEHYWQGRLAHVAVYCHELGECKSVRTINV